MRLLFRFLGFLFAFGTIVFLVGIGAAAGLVWHFYKDLPDYSQLQDYEPAVMTRVHAADGALLAEYARERRLYLPIQAIPKLVINAFIAAEDKSFYEHNGIDFSGIARATVSYVQNYGRGRRLASLFRQVGARADRAGSGLPGSAPEGAQQLSSHSSS